MFKIGDFSKLSWVSVRMLRYYDEVGLFKPIEVDPFSGYRYYSANQIRELNIIVALRDMGCSVSEISDVIHAANWESVIDALLQAKRHAVEENIRKEHMKLDRINSVLGHIKKERVNMQYQVMEKSVVSFQAISLRQVIPSYETEGMLWEKLGRFMGENKLQCGKHVYATYHEEGYCENDVDVEVVMEVSRTVACEEPFSFRESEELKNVASLLVPGDYSKIKDGFAYLAKWIEEHNKTIIGNARQIPIKGPWNEKDANNYMTELQIPID